MVRVRRTAAGKGGLQGFAQAMAAGSGNPSSPSPEPPPFDPETGEIFDTPNVALQVRTAGAPEAEMQRLVDGALARIAAAARSPVMQGDPYREVFVALAGAIELFPVLVRTIHDARHIMPEAEKVAFLAQVLAAVQKGSSEVVKRESQRWFSAFDRRTTVAIVALIIGGMVFGGVIAGLTVYRLIRG